MRGDWRQALPVFHCVGFTLREIVRADALALVEAMSSAEVNRFITPPPATRPDFERFVDWAQAERRDGRFACFAIVQAGSPTPAGVFQIRRDDVACETAEWGFVFGARTWGSGLFVSGACEVIDFAFEEMGVRRLEARAAVANGRGNGALRKLGATREGVVKNGLVRNDERLDQNVWSILDRDWRRTGPDECAVHRWQRTRTARQAAGVPA